MANEGFLWPLGYRPVEHLPKLMVQWASAGPESPEGSESLGGGLRSGFLMTFQSFPRGTHSWGTRVAQGLHRTMKQAGHTSRLMGSGSRCPQALQVSNPKSPSGDRSRVSDILVREAESLGRGPREPGLLPRLAAAFPDTPVAPGSLSNGGSHG